MRFRPANIRLINRRSKLPRLLLALSSRKDKSSDNDKNNPTDFAVLTRSLHIRPMHSSKVASAYSVIRPYKCSRLQEHLRASPAVGHEITVAMPTNEMVRRLILLREQEDRRSSF
jgi:hypothetical protein